MDDWKHHALAGLAVASGIVGAFVLWTYIGPMLSGVGIVQACRKSAPCGPMIPRKPLGICRIPSIP